MILSGGVNVKKCVFFVLAALVLTGCGAQETFETVADEQLAPVSAQVREILVELPPEAASPVMESENGKLYQCDGYEIMVQTMEAGDLDATIQTISGYSRDALTVIQTQVGDITRCEFVWASAGELGDRVGKAAVLDDGSYHYAVSILADADRVREYEGVWKSMLDSFTIG